MRIAFIVQLLICSVAVAAEPPKPAEQVYKNIQVLKGVPATELGPIMDVMQAALGVECSYCHVQGAFEKDDKQAKRTARKMFTMMQSINKQFFGGDQDVTCASCHNGRAEPRGFVAVDDVRHEEPEGAPPAVTAQQLFDKWLKASGGSAWSKLRTRVAKGSFGGFGPQPMPIEIVQVAPDRYADKLEMPRGAMEVVWTGKDGWRKMPGRVMPLPPQELGRLRRDGAIAPPLAWPKMLTDVKVRADETIGKNVAHVVSGHQGDERVRLYFDDKSGLLVRLSVLAPTIVGELPLQWDYDDYRTVDGVKLPFVVHEHFGNESVTVTLTEIKHNVPVDEARFAKPAQGK